MECWRSIIQELLEFMEIFVQRIAVKMYLWIRIQIFANSIVIQVAVVAVYQKIMKHALNAVQVQPSFYKILEVAFFNF